MEYSSVKSFDVYVLLSAGYLKDRTLLVHYFHW